MCSPFSVATCWTTGVSFRWNSSCSCGCRVRHLLLRVLGEALDVDLHPLDLLLELAAPRPDSGRDRPTRASAAPPGAACSCSLSSVDLLLVECLHLGRQRLSFSRLGGDALHVDEGVLRAGRKRPRHGGCATAGGVGAGGAGPPGAAGACAKLGAVASITLSAAAPRTSHSSRYPFLSY